MVGSQVGVRGGAGSDVEGVVRLDGDAKTLSDELYAVALIDRIPGVQRVASEIRGPEVFGNEVGKLRADAPRTANSSAELRIVPSDAVKRAAGDAVAGARNVMKVENELQVVASTQVTQGQVTQALIGDG